MASNSKSSNFTGKYGGSFTLSTNFNETSTNTLNNTSTISVSGSLKSNGGSFSSTNKNASINVYWHDNKTNTDKLVKTKEFKSVSANQTISVSGSITVTHNDDGTLSGYSKIIYRDNGYGIPDKSTVQTANTKLTSIARKTTIIDAFGWNQEEYQAPIGISIEPRIGSDAFTHTLTYSYNTVTGTLFSKKKLVRSTDSNDVIAVILDEPTFNVFNEDPSYNAVLFPKTVQEMASLIPNDKILPIKFILETFNVDTSLGTSEITFNFEVIGAKFDFNPTLQANDSLTKTLTGVSNKFIKGISTVLASFGTAKSQNGATAKTYHYSSGSENYDLTTTTKVFSSIVNGNTEFLFAITDSRGFKTENKSKKIGTDYTLLNYSSPIISKVTVQRTESLSKKVNIACEGTFWNQSFGSKTNSITLTARYKVSGSSSWNTISSVKATVSGSKFSYSGQIAADIATDSGVEVEFTATDLCKAYSLKGSETKSTSIFDIGDDYFNINGELENNYSPVITKKKLLDFIYPIGSIYMSVKNTSPQSFLGGTWVSWGSGRVPVGYDSSQTEFNSIEKTGGDKEVTLTVEQIPSHTHGSKSLSGTFEARGYGNNADVIVGGRKGQTGIVSKTVGAWSGSHGYIASGGNRTNPNTDVVTINATHEHSSVGNDGAHNNLQPYITCYMWKRTA